MLNRSTCSFCAVLAILHVEGDVKTLGRTRFSAVAMCDAKARARHGHKRLFCCSWQPGALGSCLPGESGPWEAAASERGACMMLPATFAGGEWETLPEIEFLCCA